MRVLSAAALKSLFVPGGVLLVSVVGLVYSGWLTLALPSLSFLYYCAVIGGLLLAWRFHSGRIFLSLVVLFLAQQAAIISAGQPPFIPATLHALAFLIPGNFLLIGLMHEGGFTVESLAPIALILFVESLTVTVLCGASVRARSLPVPFSPSGFAIVVTFGTAIFFGLRFLLRRKPIDNALLWGLAACFFALRSASVPRTSMAYWAASACILATAVIENSYLLAYHDELTTLPSRRAFNDALQRLKAPYSIAVVDIDHFKRCNDTYGHETGDEVLRMVASNLGRVTGGGQAYRCGGEEFNILFPGKTTGEVVAHLEELREAVERSEFRLRGGDRRRAERGPDRRSQKSRTRTRKKQSGGPGPEAERASALSVTISIGVASCAGEKDSPHGVLEAADKALYRAKASGRNRVEVSGASPRRLRSRAAGIG